MAFAILIVKSIFYFRFSRCFYTVIGSFFVLLILSDKFASKLDKNFIQIYELPFKSLSGVFIQSTLTNLEIGYFLSPLTYLDKYFEKDDIRNETENYEPIIWSSFRTKYGGYISLNLFWSGFIVGLSIVLIFLLISVSTSSTS